MGTACCQALAQCSTEYIIVYTADYQRDQKLAINFQDVIYTHSMGVLLLWHKHLCSELIDSPMRLEMFSVHLCSGRQSMGI